MLKKLYKHEFYALLRWMLFVWIGVVGLAIINRISTAIYTAVMNSGFFDSANKYTVAILTSLVSSLTVLFVVAAVAGLLVCIGLVIVRFYKNLFTKEGYFTFSIPVKPVHHIWCKLICGMVIILASFAVTLIAIVINFVGTSAGAEIMKGFGEMANVIFQDSDGVHIIFYIIEAIILFLVSLASSNLMIYCSISFGQNFKNKIGGSVISYIIINIIVSTASNFLSFFFMILALLTGEIFADILVNVSPIALIHIIMISAIVISAGMCVAYFAITATRTTKKLNLE